MNVRRTVITGVTASAFMLSGAMAFDLPKMPSIGGSAKVDVDGLSKQQAEMLGALTVALQQLSQAQSQMAEALGLKEQAATAKNTAETLKNGTLTGKDDIDKQLTSSLEVQASINDQLKSHAKLDEQSRSKFAASLPPYGAGALATVVVGKKTADTVKSLGTVTDPTVLSKLSALLYVGTKAPTMISNFGGATSNIVAFAKSNGVDTSDFEKNAASKMGG